MAGSQAVKCKGLDLGGVFCLDTGYPELDWIIALGTPLFTFWVLVLGGEYWRIRVGGWLYDASWSSAYARLLQKLLDLLDQWFGRRWSLSALNICFRIAMIYSIGLIFLPMSIVSSEDWLGDSVYWAGLGVLAWVSFFLARKIHQRHRQAQQDTQDSGRLAWLPVREQLAYVTLLVLLIIGVSSVMDVLTIAAVSTLVGVGVASGAGVRAAAVTGAVVGVAWAVDIGRDIEAEFAVAVGAIFGLLVLIIPSVNALFDWPSWAVSRWLMNRLREDANRPVFFRRAGALLVHLTLDGALAVLCLFGLTISLVNVVRLTGLVSFWGDSLSFAKEAPFSAGGIPLSAMLISTLIPTAIHLFFALFALAAIRPPKREWFAGWMEDSAGGGEWGNRAIVSAYLTFCCIFPLVVLWGAAVFVLRGLDWLWIKLGWGLESDPYPFWASIFRAAEAFVIF